MTSNGTMVRKAPPLRRCRCPRQPTWVTLTAGESSSTSPRHTQHLAAKVGYAYDMTKLTSFDFVFSQNVTVPLPPPGGPLPGTPKNSVALGLEYAHVPFAGGELLYALDSHYQSSILSSISETAIPVPGYTMLDGRINFTRSHWLATVYVDNITNTLGVNAITDPTFWGNRSPRSDIAAAHVRRDVRIFFQGVLSFGYTNARTPNT